jgi:hypothetical protein
VRATFQTTMTRLPSPAATAFLCQRTDRHVFSHLLLTGRPRCGPVFANVLTCANLRMLRLHMLHQSMYRR